MTPRIGAPGENGRSNSTPNHLPNSWASVMARQTRARGARSRIFFSTRSVLVTDIRNLQVAVVYTRPRHLATSRLQIAWPRQAVPATGDEPRTVTRSVRAFSHSCSVSWYDSN